MQPARAGRHRSNNKWLVEEHVDCSQLSSDTINLINSEVRRHVTAITHRCAVRENDVRKQLSDTHAEVRRLQEEVRRAQADAQAERDRYGALEIAFNTMSNAIATQRHVQVQNLLVQALTIMNGDVAMHETTAFQSSITDGVCNARDEDYARLQPGELFLDFSSEGGITVDGDVGGKLLRLRQIVRLYMYVL